MKHKKRTTYNNEVIMLSIYSQISIEKITKTISNVYKISSRFIILRSWNSHETLVTLYLFPLRLLA